jgi:hypothetical protein
MLIQVGARITKTLNDYQGYGTRYITSEIPTITDYFFIPFAPTKVARVSLV